MSEHTPTPWRRADMKRACRITSDPITENNGYAIADLYGPDAAANAALIVRAVNSHAALRAALSKIADEAEEFSHGDQNAQSIVRGLAAIARRALTEA